MKFYVPTFDYKNGFCDLNRISSGGSHFDESVFGLVWNFPKAIKGRPSALRRRGSEVLTDTLAPIQAAVLDRFENLAGSGRRYRQDRRWCGRFSGSGCRIKPKTLCAVENCSNWRCLANMPHPRLFHGDQETDSVSVGSRSVQRSWGFYYVAPFAAKESVRQGPCQALSFGLFLIN